MEIKIRGKNIEITKAMETKILDQMEKLNKYFVVSQSKDVVANVLVKVYKEYQRIEVTIPLKNLILRAEVDSYNIYDAMDLAIEKLERQIRKYKTRIDKTNNTSLIENFDIDEKYEDDILVRTKTINPKPMDMEEAIMQMNLLNHNFYIYKDVETNLISVVYKRTDNDYGLIETC